MDTSKKLAAERRTIGRQPSVHPAASLPTRHGQPYLNRKPRATLQGANLKFRAWWLTFSVKEMT
jgi:hypothetical protein